MSKYIYKTKKGVYEIRKKLGGILTYWGTYHTLEEAELYLSYYIGKNWIVNPHFQKTRYIIEKNKKYYIMREINNQQICFGVFDSLNEAIMERDLCQKCNWDMDLIVENNIGIEDYFWLHHKIEV